MLILFSKKTRKWGVGGQKLLILRQHSYGRPFIWKSMTTWLILSEISEKPNVGALQLSSYVRHNFQLTTILMPRKLAIVNIWCLLELPSLFSTYWPLVILISERYFYPMITRFISPLFCLCCYIVFLRNHNGLNWFLRGYCNCGYTR